MAKLELTVLGMECHGCENRLKKTLLELEEIKDVKANYESGKVNINCSGDITLELKNKIIKKIEDLDYQVSL